MTYINTENHPNIQHNTYYAKDKIHFSRNGEKIQKQIDEKKWIENYKNRKHEDGFSTIHVVSSKDEWLCEAYMKTDYSKLCQLDFEETIRSFLAYKIETGRISDNE